MPEVEDLTEESEVYEPRKFESFEEDQEERIEMEIDRLRENNAFFDWEDPYGIT